ncbi:MAG: response regulator transcription factor [Rhodothermales bacterium]
MVWIIEDDDVFRDTVQEILNQEPDVHCEHSFDRCEEALLALDAEYGPDVMLMDISLPGMSGIEGARHVKVRSPETQIIVLSVHEDNEKIFDAICAGASGYLLKPSTPARIVSAVRSTRDGGAHINPVIAGKVLEMFSALAVPKRGNYGLTTREFEILQQLVDGLTKRQIAEKIFLSFHTIDMHIRHIYSKLQVHSRSGAIAKAVRERLV